MSRITPMALRHHPGLRENGGNIGVARGELLGDDATGERVGARSAGLLRKRERPQAKLRGLLDLLEQKRSFA